MEAIMSVNNLSKHFGGLKAVSGVTFAVKKGKITGLIGPNGSGKTTTLNMISGYLTPTGGQISFEGNDLCGKKMAEINRMGIARTFQQIRLFRELTCLQNVLAACHSTEAGAWWHPILMPHRNEIQAKKVRQRALEILDFVGVYEYRNAQAKNLSYGNQRKLEIARALATGPKLLLLDEPVAGMNPTESEAVVSLLRRLRADGMTIILVEHTMNVVMNICDDIVVLDMGEIIATGKPSEILANQRVIDAYLGKRGGKIDAKN
jgi:branched-chain amino acid transport system ATP-binding protein